MVSCIGYCPPYVTVVLNNSKDSSHGHGESHGRQRRTRTEQSIETLGGVLPDGRTVDLIRDGVTRRLKLLCFDGTQYRTEDRISIEGRTFVPPALDPALQSAVTFPARVADYGCTKDLFHVAIENVFIKYGMSAAVATVRHLLCVFNLVSRAVVARAYLFDNHGTRRRSGHYSFSCSLARCAAV